jgi:hypothetical protein
VRVTVNVLAWEKKWAGFWSVEAFAPPVCGFPNFHDQAVAPPDVESLKKTGSPGRGRSGDHVKFARSVPSEGTATVGVGVGVAGGSGVGVGVGVAVAGGSGVGVGGGSSGVGVEVGGAGASVGVAVGSVTVGVRVAVGAPAVGVAVGVGVEGAVGVPVAVGGIGVGVRVGVGVGLSFEPPQEFSPSPYTHRAASESSVPSELPWD